ncbi:MULTISPECIES: hypothetical protein [Thalassospira]|uniref:hypothetical protein n=1 Tax=Thalassospira TaxID=168934 RepID=UPI0008DDD0F3|nr:MULTISPECIES: hypothetical protein [Thalassospira]MDM7975205.1 hypothetical protein [Thalassospira xiamenensis]OHZ01009.1 hypothetical protein BC440_09230 [Thalassospira sp. MIT1004]
MTNPVTDIESAAARGSAPRPVTCPLDLIGLLRIAASRHSAQPPHEKALNVLRTAIDRRAEYLNDRHACRVSGAVISVPAMVDLANAVLEKAELHDLRLPYPGAKFSLAEHCQAANDNRRTRSSFDTVGGV